MSTGEPGWYRDPGGQPGLRFWDGARWGTELRPPGPGAGPAGPPGPGAAGTPRSTETRARFDPPRFDTSPAALFQPPKPAPPSTRRSPVLWLGLAGAAVILVVGVVLISGHRSHTTTDVLPAVGATTTQAAGPTVGPQDSVYTDTGSLYTMATGPNWTAGNPGVAGSATWTVQVDPSTAAKVQVLPSRLDSPQSAAAHTQAIAQEFDPLNTRTDPNALYLVDGIGADQMADGTPAGIIHLHANPLDADNLGANLVGAALVTTKGNYGATVLILCPAESAPACLAALLPYARTLELTAS